ncbi:enoyl-CoA hydratase/isomerase family protein [Tabrizicola sp. J26]|uniref:enoyl-CoA hydratase/isomerase family protein n=1 Tax=Alitabrizicola rongguiensis TaxID=2909234 RepID=UPI001F2D92BD|nr:enoyl-CoA hydratase/isomerase family protein [Tabrizicola rongguiensis]MCF1707931.1 enoyl-CoA hydratase/isomerase family protein [Tabrizicola rongguiensis]
MIPAPILLHRDGAVANLRFNRPEALNAINQELAELLEHHLRSLSADPSIRVVVLSGAGKGFTGGGDLSVFRGASSFPEAADVLIGPLHRAVMILREMPQIVVASLHGAVAGAGLSFAMLADLAIAADTIRMNMAYARIQAVPDCGGSWALARLVGARKALEIALLSDTIGADEALLLGLVNRVVPEPDLAAETAAIANRLARQSPASARGIRDLLRQSLQTRLPDQLDAERAAFRAAAAQPEFADAIAGFFARNAKP